MMKTIDFLAYNASAVLLIAYPGCVSHLQLKEWIF